MKAPRLFFLLATLTFSGFSQSDTIYLKDGERIPCKINDVSGDKISYKRQDDPAGPLYVISASRLIRYSYANGHVVQSQLPLVPEPSRRRVRTSYQDTLNRRSAIKIHPFSYANNHIALAYEVSLKGRFNFDLEAAYINSRIAPQTSEESRIITAQGLAAMMSGGYVKPGIKLRFKNGDLSANPNPLIGRFVLFNLVASYQVYQDVFWGEFHRVYSGTPGISQVTEIKYEADLSMLAYGLLINYGRQFIFGEQLTLEYYVGVGATSQSSSFGTTLKTTNTYTSDLPHGETHNVQDVTQNINNFHGFFRAPKFGLSAAAGFRLGFILPEKRRRPNVSGRVDGNPH